MSQEAELEELAKLYAKERPYRPIPDPTTGQGFDDPDWWDGLGDWE